MYFRCTEMIINKIPALSNVQIAAHRSGKYTLKNEWIYFLKIPWEWRRLIWPRILAEGTGTPHCGTIQINSSSSPAYYLYGKDINTLNHPNGVLEEL